MTLRWLRRWIHENHHGLFEPLGRSRWFTISLLAHNLTRKLQMTLAALSRGMTEKRTSLWAFERLDTFRKGILQRAGRLTRPHGKLTLIISANQWVKQRLLDALRTLQNSA